MYATDPEPLPATFADFRHVTINAALHDQADTPLRVRARARDDSAAVETIKGEVEHVRQRLVSPQTHWKLTDNFLHVRTGDDREIVLGNEWHTECEYAAIETTLERAE